jgi:death on curing protein
MRRLSLGEVLRLHRLLIESSGGGVGLRDLGRLEAALAQPWLTFDGADLYQDVVAKAATLGFALIQGHPFIDGKQAHRALRCGGLSGVERVLSPG